eukprot:scaffold3221_cov126-Skeletonema_marinoi.AAC.13
MPHQFTYDVVASPIRPKEPEPQVRCFYTIMANNDGSLEAVDCHIHSVRYDMPVKRGAGYYLRCLIRSPMSL